MKTNGDRRPLTRKTSINNACLLACTSVLMMEGLFDRCMWRGLYRHQLNPVYRLGTFIIKISVFWGDRVGLTSTRRQWICCAVKIMILMKNFTQKNRKERVPNSSFHTVFFKPVVIFYYWWICRGTIAGNEDDRFGRSFNCGRQCCYRFRCLNYWSFRLWRKSKNLHYEMMLIKNEIWITSAVLFVYRYRNYENCSPCLISACSHDWWRLFITQVTFFVK